MRPEEEVNAVSDRLSPLDVSFLYLEEATTPMHVGSVSLFEIPARGFDYERLLALIEERIPLVPRYRQRIRWVPGYLANPVWVDDENFDVAYHVRRSALPRPGTDQQLRELVARVQSRRLDRDRPLWEMYLVEGLQENRFAIITKTHHAMVDGLSAVDIGQVLLDVTATPRPSPPDTWRPDPDPTWLELVSGAVLDNMRRPSAMIDTVRTGVSDIRATVKRTVGAAAGLLAFTRTAARSAPPTPLNVPIGEQRRYGMAATSLDDYKRIRKAHSADAPITVNDVVLTVVAGALRAWMLTRGEPVKPASTVRAMVPVSIRLPGQVSTLGNRISSYFVNLPIGEADPLVRLYQVSYAMRAHRDSGQAVGADLIAGLAGFAPPTMHALSAQVASSFSQRIFNTVVTNVPGPQFPLYAAGARMLATYPVVPLVKNQAVSIGLTSYDGGVYYGLNADRDAMADVDVLAQCIEDALAELVDPVQ